MSSRKWLISLFSFILVFVVLIELFYNLYPYNRHEVDFLVKTRMPNINNEKYETLILGDSLSRNAFGNLNLHENILELTSNNVISIAGNYFILKRYLSHNHKPKNLYIFCIPNHLYQDLDTVNTYSYFTSVFNKDEEIKDVEVIRPNIYTTQFSFDKYTESRLKSINIFRHYKQKGRVDAVIIHEESLNKLKRDNYLNSKIYKKIESAKDDKDKINTIPTNYITKIKKLCDDLDIKLTIVIEPIPSKVNDIFKQSEMYKFILNQDITLLNINDFYSFNNYFFYGDGTHISGKVNQYYQNLIDKHVIDIY
ncbi:MAG: hypothetical protein ACI9RG_001191 [Sulfurimonas sp.]|jgi:hypothetical protein